MLGVFRVQRKKQEYKMIGNECMVGCVLPSGNRGEFRILESELIRRDVRYVLVPLRAGGCAFLIEQEDLHKLPKDEKGPYLGDENSGHSVYGLSVAWLSSLK